MQTRFYFFRFYSRPTHWLMLILLIGFCCFGNAATYNLSSGSYPPCINSFGFSSAWSVSGTTYTCTGDSRVVLAAGDVVTASGAATIYANRGFTLGGTIGSSSARINLTSNYGSITSTGTTTVFGNINAGSGLVTLSNVTVNGTLTSTADINLTGGSVTGLVTSSNNTITTNGTNLGGGATAQSGMSITGGTLAGNFVMTSFNPITLSGVTMTSGSISGASFVTIQNNSTLGSASSSITIGSNSGPINVNNSTVYGNLTAPNYSTVNVTNGANVYGTCLPNSTPANACGAAPLPATPMNCSAGTSSGITGNYYNNRTLTEPVTATRSDAPIDFSWGSAAPGPTGIAADNFSVRWTGYIRVTQTGSYRFQTVSDDGVRLDIGGTRFIDNWSDHSAATNTTTDITLVAGNTYTITLQYYENAGDATIRLLWRLPGATTYVAIPGGPTPTMGAGLYECTTGPKPPISSCPTNSRLVAGITGNYFNNRTLTAPVTSVRLDGPINFDWAAGTPGPAGIAADNFSVSWNGYIYVTQSGLHRFQTNSDDGVSLTVNGDLLIDQWNDHSATVHTSAAVNLEAGKAYPIKLEFYENAGTAVIQLRWQTPGSAAYVAIPIGVNASPVTAPGLYQCNTIAGYAISHSGTGITCAGETIIFTALDFNGNAIAPVSGTNLILGTSSTSSQWVNGNTAGFDGTTTSVTKTLRQPVPATVNIDVRDNNGLVELPARDPSIIFTDAALKFNNIQNEVAGVVDNNVTLSAVKTDQVTGACVPQLTGNKTTRIAFSCTNPIACVNNEQLTLNNLAAKANNSGATITYNTVTLNFSSSGVASIPLRYSDVGQVQLHAQVDLPGSTNDPAVTLAGSSNPFIVKPYTLKVTAVQAASPLKNNPGSTNSGEGFIPAGERFNATVQSFNAAGSITPNFGNETSTSERNKIQLQMGCPERDDENDAACTTRKPDYPTGGVAGNLLIGASHTATTAGGIFSMVWDEVGSFRLEPNLSGTGYLGAGAMTKITPSGIIGRFYPKKFKFTGSSIVNSCGAFSYMEHPKIGIAFTVDALNVDNKIVKNYDNKTLNFLTANINYVVKDLNAVLDGSADVSPRFSASTTVEWNSGTLTFNDPAAMFKRIRNLSGRAVLEASSKNKYQLGVKLVAGDPVDQDEDMRSDKVGSCTSDCTAHSLGRFDDLRFGRLRLDSASGPGSADLPVNFVTEYWTGNFWAKNIDDSCTAISRNNILYGAAATPIVTNQNLNVSLNGGVTTGVYGSINATAVNFIAGDARHKFTAPGAAVTGSFPVMVNLASYPWLTSDWDQVNNIPTQDQCNPPAATELDCSLRATFVFGSYRGHDRVIYWRERF